MTEDMDIFKKEIQIKIEELTNENHLKELEIKDYKKSIKELMVALEKA